MSSLFCCSIFFDFTPVSCSPRPLRPLMPSSSAKTRSALSEAMKLTVLTRLSRSTQRSRALVNMAPLAPVAAMVRTFEAGGDGLAIRTSLQELRLLFSNLERSQRSLSSRITLARQNETKSVSRAGTQKEHRIPRSARDVRRWLLGELKLP